MCFRGRSKGACDIYWKDSNGHHGPRHTARYIHRCRLSVVSESETSTSHNSLNSLTDSWSMFYSKLYTNASCVWMAENAPKIGFFRVASRLQKIARPSLYFVTIDINQRERENMDAAHNNKIFVVHSTSELLHRTTTSAIQSLLKHYSTNYICSRSRSSASTALERRSTLRTRRRHAQESVERSQSATTTTSNAQTERTRCSRASTAASREPPSRKRTNERWTHSIHRSIRHHFPTCAPATSTSTTSSLYAPWHRS